MLPSGSVAAPQQRRRFMQEAQAASALNHPNIVTIYDVGSSDDTDYIAMEYVQGKTMDALISAHGMKVKEVLRIAIQIAAGLERAHAAHIIHRDLKPGNVMVADDESTSWRPWIVVGVVLSILLVAGLIGLPLLLVKREPEAALRTVPLTSYPGNESQPAFSPDGKQIAFLWDGEAAEKPHIYVKLIDSGSPRALGAARLYLCLPIPSIACPVAAGSSIRF